MLVVSDLSAGYGASLVLQGIGLKVKEGEIAALIGPNGAGKTTCLRAIAGLLPAQKGEVLFQSKSISGLRAHQIARMGLVLVPEGRLVLGRLTVKENLLLGAYSIKNRARVTELLEQVFTMFPVLRERSNQLAGTLSGGEQQMLAIARGLMCEPRMLLLDEPSMGLAPKLVNEVFHFISKLNREMGLTVLVADQNAYQSLAIANWAYIMESGSVVMSGNPAELVKEDAVRKKYLAESSDQT